MTTTKTSRSKRSPGGKNKENPKTNKTSKETLKPIKEIKKQPAKATSAKHASVSGRQRKKSRVQKVTATKAKPKLNKMTRKKSIDDKTLKKQEISSCYCAELFEGRHVVGGKVEKEGGPEKDEHKEEAKGLEGTKLPLCWVCRLRAMARKSRLLRGGTL